VGKKVLIADDEPNIVVSLEFLLRDMGYDVRSVGDGGAALAAVADWLPDLLLLDVMMPKLSGYDVCQRIRENPAWEGVRIVMVSARGRDIDVSKGLAVGADAYVTKPFSTQDLMSRVRALLGE
jgi:DNA-binding response OmpR family regulator